MSEEDRLKLENELLLTKSKAQMINLYLDLQQKIEQLENIRKEAIRYIQNNQLYNFDYDKEELFEIVSDKVAKEYLLNILNKGSEK